MFFVGTSSYTTNLLYGVILLFKTLVQRSKINTINLHKEISASLCPVIGWRHEMNNPVRLIQVTRGLGGSPRRFPIMAYIHRRRCLLFMICNWYQMSCNWISSHQFPRDERRGLNRREEGVEGDRLHHLLFPTGKAKRNRPLWHNTMYLVSDCHFIIYPRVRSVIWRPVAH